jgi:cholesterol transport system auxiliary component
MSSSHPSHLRRATLLWAALLGTGCTGGLLPKPAAAPTRYTLGDAPPGAAAAPPLAPPPAGAPSIVVALPSAAPGFDSTRMVYLRQPQVLQAYAFAEWVDTPARLLLPLMVQALQNQGGFRAVLQAPSSATGALRLETELLRLQHDHTQGPSVVRLTLRAVLLETATRLPLATREFDALVPAPSDSPAGCVAAAATATRQVLAELATFVSRYAAPGATGTRREP